MGRVLQKKKNKSSVSKVHKKPKSKKKILHNPIIAAHWFVRPSQLRIQHLLTPPRNSKETLTQNYRRLGLTSRLNHSAGGSEKIPSLELSSLSHQDASNNPDSLRMPGPAPKTLTPLDARVERDPVTGRILRVLDDPTAPLKSNPLNDPLNDLENSDEEWSGFAHVASGTPASTSVIEQLEAVAASGERKAPRKQSSREEEWVQRLMERHGDNYAAMFRDRKLNPMQQSEGDIRKRVKKWTEKHGRAV
jgi:nucleolar protein 16